MRQKAVFVNVQGNNEEWALDFATDALASQRHLRIVSVVDGFTRECLARALQHRPAAQQPWVSNTTGVRSALAALRVNSVLGRGKGSQTPTPCPTPPSPVKPGSKSK